MTILSGPLDIAEQSQRSVFEIDDDDYYDGLEATTIPILVVNWEKIREITRERKKLKKLVIILVNCDVGLMHKPGKGLEKQQMAVIEKPSTG